VVGSAGGQYTKSNQKNKRTDTDQTCTQANIVAAFPLITARDSAGGATGTPWGQQTWIFVVTMLLNTK